MFYFFDIWVSSIAARCRTVLAEYNMSCDDVSGHILFFVKSLSSKKFNFARLLLCRVTEQTQFVLYYSRYKDYLLYFSFKISLYKIMVMCAVFQIPYTGHSCYVLFYFVMKQFQLMLCYHYVLSSQTGKLILKPRPNIQ